AALADRAADEVRPLCLGVALAVFVAAAAGAGKVFVGVVTGAHGCTSRSNVSWARPCSASHRFCACSARATSAISAPRVLRKTVSKMTRRPGASQYVTLVCVANKWNLSSRTFPPRCRVYGSRRSTACSADRPTRKSTRPKSRSVRPDSQDRTSGSISTSYNRLMHQMLYASDAIAKPGRPGSHSDNLGSLYAQATVSGGGG